jgi:cation:H+ antiporter
MITILHIIGGLSLLFVGGEILVRNAVSLAEDIGLSPFIIGLTIVGYGTSAPEMVVGIQSVLEGHPDIASGNIIGTNIADIFLVLGLAALIYPVEIDKKTNIFNVVFLLLVTVVFSLICYMELLNWAAGIFLLVVLAGYIYIAFIMGSEKKLFTKKEKAEIETEVDADIKGRFGGVVAIMLCTFGILLLGLGANLVITGAIEISEIFGLSEATIGLTIIAFGTVLPELVTSVIAAYRKRSQIIMGNIIGGNLFNILGIMGFISVLRPIVVPDNLLVFDLPILIFAVFLLTVLICHFQRISRRAGGMLVLIYIIYIAIQFHLLEKLPVQ